MKIERSGFGITNPPPGFYQHGIWRCPSTKSHDGSDLPYYGYNAFGVLAVGNRPTNLGLSGHYMTNAVKIAPIKESEVIDPSELIAVGDSDTFTFMRSVGYDYIDGIVRHQNQASVLMCDGHVEILTAQSLFEDASDDCLERWNRDHQPHRESL